MAVAFGASAAGAGTNVVTIPASTAAGDLLILTITAFQGTGGYATPSGWTLIDSTNTTNAPAYNWWRIATSTDHGTTVTVTGGNGTPITKVIRFTGADGTTPINAHNIAIAASGTSISPSVTPSVDNCMLWIGLNSPNGGTWGTPTGFTPDLDPDGGDVIDYYKLLTGGSGAGQSVTGSGGSAPLVALLIVIAPAGGAAVAQPPGVQVVAPTPLSLSPRLPDNRTFAVSHYNDTSPPPKMPPGIPLVTAAAVPPHAADNWTWLESVYPGMAPPVQPPGQQTVAPSAATLSPRAADNWSFRVSHYPETSPPSPLPPGATYTAPGAVQQPGPTIALAGLTQPPPAPLPAGQQVVTPAALAPHAGDNWTFTQSHYPGVAPLPLPPGAQVTTPAAVPPHASDNWTQTVSVYLGMAAASLPPGLQFVAPTAATLAPRATDNWSFSVAHYNDTSPPPPLPAGQQVVTPAAIAPHTSDNWTLVQPGQQHVILLIAPPGVQTVTPAARPPHAADNWTAVQPGLTQAVNALPPGAQTLTPAAIPPHTADNWTSAHAGLTQPPPAAQPPGQQVTTPAAVPPHTTDNWTLVQAGLTQPAGAVTSGYGSGLYGADLYGGSGVFTGYGSGLYGAGIYSGESASQVPGLQIVVPPPFRTHAGDNYSFSVSHPPFFLSPPPPLPPGLQIVTPAAVPPHLGDNWTRAIAGLTQPAPSKLPPGQQSVTVIPSIGNRNIDWSWMPPNTTARMLDEDPLFPVSPLGPLTEGGISTLTARAGSGISTLSPRGPFAISELTEDEALS